MDIGVKTPSQSNTIRVCIVTAVAVASALGVHLSVTDAQIDKWVMIVGAVIAIVGPLLAAKFRVSNNLVVSATTQNKIDKGVVTINPVIPAILFMVMMTFMSGCAGMSSAQKLYTAQAGYNQALNGVNELMQDNVITDPKVKEAIYQAKNECHKALVDAKAAYNSGNTIGFRFAFSHLEHALGTLINYHLSYTSPAGKEVSWVPQKSQPSLSRFSCIPSRSTTWRLGWQTCSTV